MSGLFIGAAVLAAVVVVGWRSLQRTRSERRKPGATPRNAIPVRRFDEIDANIGGLRCRCGGPLRTSGESSAEIGEQRLRLVRLVCKECEHDQTLHFDVTTVFH